jgi:hypothetical protein
MHLVWLTFLSALDSGPMTIHHTLNPVQLTVAISSSNLNSNAKSSYDIQKAGKFDDFVVQYRFIIIVHQSGRNTHQLN